jgi:hypothetical protein
MIRTPAEEWPPGGRPRGRRLSRNGPAADPTRIFENTDLEREIAQLQALWPGEKGGQPRNGSEPADAQSPLDAVMLALGAIPDFSLPALARQFLAMAREQAELRTRLERSERERADLAGKLKRASASLAQARWDRRMTEARLEQLHSAQESVLDLLIRALPNQPEPG